MSVKTFVFRLIIVGAAISMGLLRLTAQEPSARHYKPDLATGRSPTAEEVAAAEKGAEANPGDFATMRKLGKTYFYRFFGAGEKDAADKARKALTRALELQPDDAETLAFLGSVDRLTGRERQGIELMSKARKLDPTTVGVLGLLSGFGDVTAMEQLRASPEFAGMSDHGRQRILLGLGKDRVRQRQPEEARTLFTEGLAINKGTPEARMLRSEIEKLK